MDEVDEGYEGGNNITLGGSRFGLVVISERNCNAVDAMYAEWVSRVCAVSRVVFCSNTIFIFLHRVHRVLRVKFIVGRAGGCGCF